MDFSFSRKQLAYQKSIREFARDELNFQTATNEKEGEFPFDNWEKCSNIGYTGFLTPEEYGGIGENLITTILCLEALSYSCLDSGLVHAIVTQLCCGVQLSLYGNHEQKQKYLTSIAEGKLIAAQAITESDAGSDLGSMQTIAKRKDDKYIINGTKMYISNGPIADVVLVFA